MSICAHTLSNNVSASLLRQALLFAAATLVMSGCSCSNIECGPGTYREGNQCLPENPSERTGDIVEVENGDGLDAIVEVEDGEGLDNAGDVPKEDVEGCEECIPGYKRCNGRQILVCVRLPDDCTTWAVSQTCSQYEECQEPSMECEVLDTEPPSFLVEVDGASWGIGPESMLWDGAVGLLSFAYSVGSSRIMGLLRFTVDGPVHPPRILGLDDQGSALVAAGGRSFIYWTGSDFNAKIAEVLGDETLSALLDANANDSAENAHAFSVGAGIILFQRFTGTCTNWGFFNPAAWSITWYPAKPMFSWYRSTVAAVETSGGFSVAWLNTGGSALSLQGFDAAGEPLGEPAISPIEVPDGDTYMVALSPTPDGYFLVWAEEPQAETIDEVPNWGLHAGRLDSSGSLLTNHRIEFAFDRFPYSLKAYFVGTYGDEILVGCYPDSKGKALVIARVNDEGNITGEVLINSRGGVARYANGTLANCWGISDVGIRCGVISY